MNSLMNSGGILAGINWAKAKDVGMALLVSPLVGFICTAILFLLTGIGEPYPEPGARAGTYPVQMHQPCE